MKALVLALLCGAALVPTLASAQVPTQQTDPRAEHERAEALFDAGDHAEAAEIWESLLRSVGPDKAWRANYNLGLCYAAIGRPTLAVERFEAFASRIAALPDVPDELVPLRDDAQSRVRSIRASHGRLELAAAPGVKVRIDGGPLRDVGFTAYVTPGRHVLEIVDAVGGVRRETVDVAAGRALAVQTKPKVVVPPTPLPLPPTPPPDRVVVREEPPGFPTVWVVVGASVTAASFVFPGVMFALASSARDDAARLGAGHTDYTAARDTFDDRAFAYELSYLLPAGLGAITAAIAVVGAVQLATWSPAPATEMGCTTLGISRSAGSGGTGLEGAACWLSGSF